MDFNETYGPVIKITSVRAILSLSACLSLALHQMNVLTVLLNGYLNKNIGMEIS